MLAKACIVVDDDGLRTRAKKKEKRKGGKKGWQFVPVLPPRSSREAATNR